MNIPLSKQSIEGSFQLTNLNDAVLFLEKHFFHIKSETDIENPLCQKLYWLMTTLAAYSDRKIKLKRILERTNLLEILSGQENWQMFNYHINELENDFLYKLSTKNLIQHNSQDIKNILRIMDGLIKFKLQYYRNHMLELNINCREITKEDLELDVDLNNPKNYEFRLYLKNSKAGARIKKVFIDNFGFENIDLAKDIFGNGKDEVIKKLQKKFSLKNNRNDNDALPSSSPLFQSNEGYNEDNSYSLNTEDNSYSLNTNLNCHPGLDPGSTSENNKYFEFKKIHNDQLQYCDIKNYNIDDCDDKNKSLTKKELYELKKKLKKEKNNAIINKIVDPPPALNGR